MWWCASTVTLMVDGDEADSDGWSFIPKTESQSSSVSISFHTCKLCRSLRLHLCVSLSDHIYVHKIPLAFHLFTLLGVWLQIHQMVVLCLVLWGHESWQAFLLYGLRCLVFVSVDCLNYDSFCLTCFRDILVNLPQFLYVCIFIPTYLEVFLTLACILLCFFRHASEC